MKFIVSSSLLLRNLQKISGVLSTNNTLPILDDFLFELNEEYLSITASDLHTTMTVSITPEKTDETGIVAIPSKILLDTLKTLADVPVSFIIDKETLNIEMSAGDGIYRLPGHKSDEYPQMPEKDDVTDLSISASVMLNAINKTIFAAGNDELRPVMSGVLCEIWENSLTFVATDAHKLVRYRRNDVGSENPSTFILPKKPLNQLKLILNFDEEVPVKLEYNQTNAYFTFDNIKLVCRLVEGKYPNYEAVIPQENPNILTVDRIPFLNALKRVSIFANQSTHQVRLKMNGQELLLSAEDVDFSNEAKERLTCHFDGEDMEIGFNSKFLQEMVNNLDTDQVRLEMSAPNRAGIIFPVSEEESSEEDILMLVMPVMLNT
ncbi:MAG: DNA polymerase III subunit beta [Bacteroidota bacterium]|nr:DNA polymerase III subunit beta [Bacteroidota bacterium]